jgi:hypothetical protein
MKKQIKILFIAWLALSSLHSFGQLYGVKLDGFEISKEQGNLQTGITLFSIHRTHSIGLSYNAYGSKQLGFSGQLTPLGFHHAYLSKDVSPLIGFQAYREHSYKGERRPNQWKIRPEIGFKYAYKYLIGECTISSDLQDRNYMLNTRMGFILFVPNRCLKKRMDKHYSSNALRF